MKRRRDTGAGLDEIGRALAELQQRMERLERHQARDRENATAQQRRLDVAYEDCVDALELLRRRVADLEGAPHDPAP